jgi:hypothetical protein
MLFNEANICRVPLIAGKSINQNRAIGFISLVEVKHVPKDASFLGL